MKKIFNQFLILSLLVLVLVSCKKDENKIYYEGGTAPVLTASSTADLVLSRPNAAQLAVKFSWTNPDYQLTTGLSSQNVFYNLQVDTTGSNFTNPNIQEISISGDLELNLTVKDLNTVLGKLELTEDVPHNVEFRLKSTLVNNAAPLYSNIIKMVVTPYLDVAVPVPPTGELYITGDGTPSSWTNTPPASQKANRVSLTEYNIIMNFSPGYYYKFLSTLTQWQPQYGGSSATGGDLGYNMGSGSDPDAIPTPAVAGTYKVTLNFKTGKYTVVKL